MAGYVELIYGSMYSGKTEELIRRLKRCKYAGQKFQLFKPKIDNRYGVNNVATHDNASKTSGVEKLVDVYLPEGKKQLFINEYYKIAGGLRAEVVTNATEILDKALDSTQVIAIDEIQFFDTSVIQVVNKLIKLDKRIILVGLDMYASGKPFGEVVPYFACTAKYVTKLHAICIDCGKEAYASYKIDGSDPSVIDVGSNGKYIALCENCIEKRNMNGKRLDR